MKTTLLITTYNWPKALELVLYSVLHQHVMPDEVVIADDGSTEETKKLIDRYAVKMPVPVIWVWQEDKGFRRTSILNKAIAKATGDYIIQVDGDVVLSSHFVEDHIEMAQKGCFVCGSRVLLSAQISKKNFGYKGSQCESLEHAFQLCKQQLPFSCVPQIAGFSLCP